MSSEVQRGDRTRRPHPHRRSRDSLDLRIKDEQGVIQIARRILMYSFFFYHNDKFFATNL